MQAINLQHVHAEAIGYGRMGMMLADALRKEGVTVFDHLPSPTHPEPEPHPLDDVHPRLAGTAEVVCWLSVPSHARGWRADQTPMILTMWEATRLPEQFRENIHEFETVMVPSDQNVELFSQFHPNVHRVLLGVDPARWHFTPRREPETYFNFLHAGSGSRKGPDLAVDAFHKAFPDQSWGDGPIPMLTMKNPRGENFGGDRVQVISGRVSAEEEVAIYEDAHCYLQPSRGEGFGLQPLQAIAQGIPTVLTDAHGHASFAHLGWGLSTTMKKADYFIYGDAGQWWEPNLDELVDHMRAIYDDYDAACEYAKQSAWVVAEQFTWQRTADRFLDVVGRDRLGLYTGSDDWYHPASRLFRVRVNRPYGCDIAGYSHKFEPGHDYYEVADVKRILFESDILDPECISDDEHGLSEEEAKRIPEYSARHSFCHACGQQLNSAPTRADAILAAMESR